MTKILIVEDDLNVLNSVKIALAPLSVDLYTCTDGMQGLREFHAIQPDLVILDVYLPLMDGITLCGRIREFSDVPIVMMSAEAIEEEDIVIGLEAGADEYMRKPIGHKEFPARVKALLRRTSLIEVDEPAPTTGYDDGYLVVDIKTRLVKVKDEEQRLTPTEFKLLTTFLRHRGQVLTFQQLLQHVWGHEYTSEHHYPRIYVSHLRRKIEPDQKKPTYIQNEYGVGYRFVGT